MTVSSLFAFKETDPETELPNDVKLYIRLLFVQTSVTNLCSLVLDRYMAVKKPLKYLTFMKRRRVIQMVFLSWAIPVFFYAIRSFLNFTFKTHLIDNIIIWLDTIIFKFVPFFMLIFCFSCVLSVICKHDRVVRNVIKQLRFNNPVLYRPQDSAAVKIMAIVIGVFLLRCGFRLVCGILKFSGNSQGNAQYDLLFTTILLLVLNSAVNPLLTPYSRETYNVEKEIKRLICRASDFVSNHSM